MRNAVETTVPLVGRAKLTTRPSGNVWSYPDLHGEDMPFWWADHGL